MIGLSVHVRATVAQRFRVAAIVALIATALAPARPALAATLTLAPTGGSPGTSVEAVANGFGAGPVTFWWDGAILLGIDPSGRVRTLTFEVPAGASAGAHTVRACFGSQCPPATVYADATFTVTGGPTPASTPAPTPRPTPRPTAAPAATSAPSAPAVTGEPSPPVDMTPSAGTGGGPIGTLPAGAGGSSAAPGSTGLGPNEPGTVTVRFPWLNPATLGLLAIAAVLVFLIALRSIRMAQRRASTPPLMKGLATGTHHPPSDTGTWRPDILKAVETKVSDSSLPASGVVGGNETISIGGTQTEAPAGGPRPQSPPTYQHEVGHYAPDAEGDLATEPPPEEGPLKGSKIKSN